MERVGGGRESESESVACWSENHIKNRWYSAAFKKFIAHEFGNCAYVEASPSFGSVSNDTLLLLVLLPHILCTTKAFEAIILL